MSSRSRSRSPKAQPDFTPSGFLQKHGNKSKSARYAPPRDSAQPREVWSLFVYKGSEEVDCFHLGRREFHLFGRGENCDVLTRHPSCSKEHAVIQFRQKAGEIRPYLIDLETTNGTKVNGETLQPSRYYELRSQDLIRFAHSTRDYMLVKSPSD